MERYHCRASSSGASASGKRTEVTVPGGVLGSLGALEILNFLGGQQSGSRDPANRVVQQLPGASKQWSRESLLKWRDCGLVWIQSSGAWDHHLDKSVGALCQTGLLRLLSSWSVL